MSALLIFILWPGLPAAGVYKATVGSDLAVDWFSYYSNTTDSAADYDALFAALNMMNDKIEFLPPPSAEDPSPQNETLIEALEDTFDYGLGEINGNTMKYGANLSVAIYYACL